MISKESSLNVEVCRVDKTLGMTQDIAEQQSAQEQLRKMQDELRAQKQSLEEKSLALSEIIERFEDEKTRVKKQVVDNIHKVVMPVIRRWERKKVVFGKKHADLLRHYLDRIALSYELDRDVYYERLSPRELEICSMMRQGLKTREIARLLQLSLRTVETHRYAIRKKFNLLNSKVNLMTYLCNK